MGFAKYAKQGEGGYGMGSLERAAVGAEQRRAEKRQPKELNHGFHEFHGWRKGRIMAGQNHFMMAVGAHTAVKARLLRQGQGPTARLRPPFSGAAVGGVHITDPSFVTSARGRDTTASII